MSSYQRHIIFLIAMAIIHCAYGQKPNITYIQSEEGLNANNQFSNNAIAMDKNGFVWITTMGGLNRWDGYEVKSYHEVSNNGIDLPNKYLTSVVVDSNNNLWLGSLEEGIIFFDQKTERFIPFDSIYEKNNDVHFTQINKLIIDKNERLFIASAFQGLHVYDIKKNELKPYGDIEDIAKASLNAMLLSQNGNLILTAWNGIYYESSPGHFDYYFVDQRKYLTRIEELPKDQFITHTQNDNTHFILDAPSKSLKQNDNVIPQIAIQAKVDNQNQLWTSYIDGTLTKENLISKKFESHKITTKVYNNEVNVGMITLFPAAKNKMYYMSLGSGAGVFNTDEEIISNFLNKDHYLFKMVNGIMYYAKNSAIYTRINNTEKLFAQLLSPYNSNVIVDYLITKEGDLWISHTEPNGYMSHFDKNGNPLEIGIKQNGPFQFHQLNNNDVIGDFRKHTEIPVNDIKAYYKKLNKNIPADFGVKYFLELKNGDLLIAPLRGGVIRLYDNLSKYEVLTVMNGCNTCLNSNNTYYMFEHNSGLVYLATDMGINAYNPKTKKINQLHLPRSNTSNLVHGMAEDNNGRLWLQMDERLVAYAFDKNEFYTYPLKDYYKQENIYPRDMQVDNNGNLYFQGYNGIFKFDINEFFKLENPSQVLITDLYVNRNRIFPQDDYQLLSKSTLYQKNITVPFKYRDLGFSFVSVEGKENDVTYYYRLSGYQDEWQMTNDRTIHFTNIDPGEYTFEVKAKSGNGKWTNKISALKIKVEPPWYQRWYAYVIYTITLSFLAYLIYRIRINQLIRYQNLRTKVSSDLHDDVGSILTGISMQSELLSYDKTGEDATSILNLAEMSREAMDKMRDIVWALDARKDKYEDLVTRMKDYAETMLTPKNIHFTFEVNISKVLQNINPEQRQNLYLIYKEAITNILKHSNANEVIIRLERNSSDSFLEIKDNGTLINTERKSGQGLSNIEMRSKRLGGNVIINSDNGYCIKVTF